MHGNNGWNNFDTQFQRMRYFVYTVGKNVNMIKSKNRSTSLTEKGSFARLFVSLETEQSALQFGLHTFFSFNYSQLQSQILTISNERKTYTRISKFNLKYEYIKESMQKKRSVLLTRMMVLIFCWLINGSNLSPGSKRSNVRQILLICGNWFPMRCCHS